LDLKFPVSEYMSSVFRSLLTQYSGYCRDRLVRKTQHPDQVQAQFLRSLLHHQRHTEWGERFRIAEIRNPEGLRDRFPVSTYQNYEADVARIAAGARNILTPDPVRFMTITSGTTGKRKWIPVTQRFQNTLQKANLASMGFAMGELQRRGQTFGKVLVTNSVQISGKTEAGIEYGLASTGSLRMSQWITKPIFAVPHKLLQITDSPTRHFICLLFGLHCRELQSIAANFPMLMLRNCEYLDKFSEPLIQAIRSGTTPAWLDLTPSSRNYIEQQLTENPTRAAELEHILQRQGGLTPRSVWPNLTVVSTARGGTSDFYFQRFADYFGDTPVFGGVYGCSEATFGVAHAFNEDSCILAIESGFYEFVPATEWDKAHPKTLMPSEVNVGDRYRLLVTNDTGFYRYDIGDVVEVVGFYQNTPLIVFRHRIGGQLNSTSEKTTEFHVIQVMRRLQQEFSIALDDFCVTLSEHDIPAHYWVNIELKSGMQLERPEAFLQRFDEILQDENSHYQVMRRDQVPPPCLRVLARGSFNQLRQRLLNAGTPENQLKIPHVSEDRQLLSDFPIQQEVAWPNIVV
jgi:hypothetical protein